LHLLICLQYCRDDRWVEERHHAGRV
jgi:hypothetical protein